ncbi:hypothetical protein CRV08_01340 [Halarcobacter ebronensis]|uniref:Transglycosylase SLT domain-containing protein n=1 Tax=Halarcobacter ebronensis TaxID=1462615 RepID=A0A4V1LS27_9BACT|nr:transglycosylase SLT domain-containing protein [Halarcobacter ebronensis]RXJ70238.1 hypothetical protein CRV08_01340 [Halarcobacter ebronensis]
MKKLLISSLCALSLLANETLEVSSNLKQEEQKPSFILDINYISTLEKGIKKDFFINEYLKTNITSDEAYNVISYLDNMSLTIFKNFAKKFGHDETLGVAQCINMPKEEIVGTYADCIVSGLDLKKASTLSLIDLQMIIQKTKDKYPLFAKKIAILSSSIPFTKLITQKEDIFYDLFLGVDNSFREKYFNYKFPKTTFEKIINDKINFNKLLKTTLTDPNMDILNSSLNGLNIDNLDLDSIFYLALNAIRLNDYNSAYKYLQEAKNITTDKNILNKFSFWIYLITKDEEELKKLSQSDNLDFYSYYAKELLIEKVDTLDSKNIEFIHQLLKNYDIKKAALLYSIAKIKSDFNKDYISEDFNKVGLFKLNPNELKNKNIVFENIELFNEDLNLKYANLYLDSLNLDFKRVLTSYLKYFNDSNDISILESKSNSLLELFIKFESLENKDIEEFLLNYCLYYNFISKRKDKITINTIFENLLDLSQK